MELYLYRKQGEKIGCETGSSKISIIGKGLLRTGDPLCKRVSCFVYTKQYISHLHRHP